MALTDIANRLTPSVPIELTFAAQPVATGKKFTTLFGHMASSGGTGLPYQVYTVVNVGNAAACLAEVNALAGAGSQIGAMAQAFVNANLLAGNSNFPAFRVVLLPYSEAHFGPNGEAISAVQFLRSDLFVSCYPAGDSTNRTTLLNLVTAVSGIDRDLQGQFGSFAVFGSIEALSTQIAYNLNSRYALVASLPDTNTALVTSTGNVTIASNLITSLSSVAGIYPGAVITGTGIPTGTIVQQVSNGQVMMSAVATTTASSESITFQNVVSQAPEIVASAHAAVMMALAFPYVPLTNVLIGGLVAPRKTSDWIMIDPNGTSESALTNGLSPLKINPDGSVRFIRTRTTYTTLADGVSQATAYIDWQDLVVMNDFREEIYLVTQNPPFNNNPGGSKASKTIAALLKDEVLRLAQSFEDQDAFQGVQTLAPQFVVAPSTTSRGRFDFKIPVNVIPGLFVIAGNIQAVTTDDFTL